MTDSIETSKAFIHHRNQIDAAVIQLRNTVDTRLLMSGLLAHAAMVAETLIAAGLSTPEGIVDTFAAAAAEALTPQERTVPVEVREVDCDLRVERH
jgi:hypothetical protein